MSKHELSSLSNKLKWFPSREPRDQPEVSGRPQWLKINNSEDKFVYCRQMFLNVLNEAVIFNRTQE